MTANNGSDLPSKHRVRLLEIQGDLRALSGTNLPKEVLLLQCRTCNTIKPISEYRKASANYYGLQVHCKQCRVRNAPRYDAIMKGEKTCVTCKQTKPVLQFPVDSKLSDGRANACTLCNNARTRRSRQVRQAHTQADVVQRRQEQTFALMAELGLTDIPSEDIKRCVVCNLVKYTRKFHLNKVNRDGLDSACKRCFSYLPPGESIYDN